MCLMILVFCFFVFFLKAPRGPSLHLVTWGGNGFYTFLLDAVVFIITGRC